jgi:hypothetical protein
MDTILKLGAAVAAAMLHNYPVLESIAILPLLLKNYLWVILGCLLVMLLTLGVERNNNYALSNLFTVQTALFGVIQTVYTVLGTALVFFIKQYALRVLLPSRSEAPKPD